MGLRSGIARAAGVACLWGLRNVLHRNATTLPGKVALALDPRAIESLAAKLNRGSIVVCGTNGKTTTNNIVAEALERAGMSVLCNRVGANMASGIATALLPGRRADWGVFEADELSTVHIVPQLKPRYLFLLNLFRDQLDRCGELERVQEAVVRALAGSPDTVLAYNADDPLCRGVAEAVEARGGKTVAFGVAEPMGLPEESASAASFCQRCGTALLYEYRQYGQLGDYACPRCGFGRGDLDVAAHNARVGESGVSFEVGGPLLGADERVEAPFGGAYMVYNLTAAYLAARLAGADTQTFCAAIRGYRPENGRLQRFDVDGRHVTLNLAKNPTGYNQNLLLVMADAAPKVVYVVVNDGYGDGRDVSWLWDVEFERLREAGEVKVYVGGHRTNDVQVRMKYAGIEAAVAETVGDVLAASAELPPEWHVWALPNYTALWPVKADLERMGESR